MKRLISHSLLFLSLIYASCSQATPTNFGVIAYWGNDAAAYANTPYGSYMVINPNSGALNMTADEVAAYKKIVGTIRSKGGKVIGYIPTGYNYNTTAEKTRFNNIGKNINAYKNTIGNMDGYFFDEAAFDDTALTDAKKCSGTKTKLTNIRTKLNQLHPQSTAIWNMGWAGMDGCFLKAAVKNEHVVVYEASVPDYTASAAWLNNSIQSLANSLGVNTWLLIYGANQTDMQTVLKTTNANYVYITDVKADPNQEWGGPIWNNIPTFWGNTTNLLSERGCLFSLNSGGSC